MHCVRLDLCHSTGEGGVSVYLVADSELMIIDVCFHATVGLSCGNAGEECIQCKILFCRKLAQKVFIKYSFQISQMEYTYSEHYNYPELILIASIQWCP